MDLANLYAMDSNLDVDLNNLSKEHSRCYFVVSTR